jgi:hypothetical protein
MRNNYSLSNRQIQICKKDVCIKAEGELANKIAGAVIFAGICLGLAFIIKAAK